MIDEMSSQVPVVAARPSHEAPSSVTSASTDHGSIVVCIWYENDLSLIL